MRLTRLIAAAMLALSTVAAAAPTRFTATVQGQGPDVILIPGLVSPASVWDGLAARLRRDHRVHLIEVAGFAGAPVAGAGEGPVVAPLAEELAGYIADHALRAPAVIGHSLGGEAALMLAARHPQAVGRVMAVDAFPFYPLSMNPAATVEMARPVADQMRAQLLAQSPEAFAKGEEASLRRLVKTDAARAALLPLAARSDRSVTARAVHELMVTDLRPELARIRAPLTIVYAYDPAYGVPPERIDALFAGAYAGAPGARLKRIDGAFHFIMLDQPEAFAGAVADFLK